MSLTLTASYTALGPGLQSSCLASGGTEPYTYSVLPDGAGGSILNGSTDPGLYTAPATASSDPKLAYDTVQVEDALGALATVRILVGSPLLLFCEIIQRELGLASGRVYLWDQKIMQPTDSDLYVAISVTNSKPFGNTNRPDSSGMGLSAEQSVNMLDTLGIDIISRGPAARDRKAEVILALGSTYAETQQELNSFRIGQLPADSQFVNLSELDGAAIPYRFRIAVNIQYFVKKTTPIDYFDQFSDVEVTTEP